MFKAGDKIERVGRPLPDAPIGFVTTVEKVVGAEVHYVDKAGDRTWSPSPEPWQPVPEGPVRTETVTKRRIVPGVYGRLGVGEPTKFPDCDRPDGPPRFEVGLALEGWEGFTADELDALADTARQLAEALRDGLD